MPANANEIVLALTDALPRSADRRSEIVAVGMLATALISTSPPGDRAELVDTFCKLLRTSIAGELN